MTNWFVTRHPGAVEWARRRGIVVDRWVTHLEPIDVEAGDVVMGALPVNHAAAICEPDDMLELRRDARAAAVRFMAMGVDVIHYFHAGPAAVAAIVGAELANGCRVVVYQHDTSGYRNFGPLRLEADAVCSRRLRALPQGDAPRDLSVRDGPRE